MSGRLDGDSGKLEGAALQQLDVLVAYRSVLVKFLGQYLIPMYKRERTSTYHRVLKQFIVQEMSNAQGNERKWLSVYNSDE